MQKTVAAIGCICVCVLALSGKYLVDRKNLSGQRTVPPVTEASAQYESHSLQRFSMGFDTAIADLLWVGLLQNASHEPLHDPGVSWEYAQINAITNLDRNSGNAYDFGSAFLSVFRRDKIGAKNILQKWTVNFPTRWKPHYILGFHLYSEMGDYPAAAREILKAADLPYSPIWLHSLGVRLMSEEGGYLPALHIALGLYPSLLDNEGRDRLRTRIRSLRYHLQRKQWDAALAAFRQKRHQEPQSLLELQPYRHLEREVAQVEEESQNHEELRELTTERFRFEYNPQKKKVVGILSKQDQVLEISGTYRN